MQHLRLLHLWVMLVLVVGTGTIAASTHAACTGTHCVYLPLISTPEVVTISDVQLHGTHYEGYTNISGDVLGTTSTSVYSVTLEVRTFDDQGNVVDTSTGYPVFAATLPGQPNPFFFGMPFPPYEYLPYDIRVVSVSRTHPRTYRSVEIDVASAKCMGNDFRVEGTITNQYEEALEEVKGVVWNSSSPYGLFPQQFAARLEPSQTVPFSSTIAYEACGVFVPPTYQIAVQGVVPQ